MTLDAGTAQELREWKQLRDGRAALDAEAADLELDVREVQRRWLPELEDAGAAMDELDGS